MLTWGIVCQFLICSICCTSTFSEKVIKEYSEMIYWILHVRIILKISINAYL